MKERIATVDVTRSILEKYQINPKNRYGQNFLVVPTIPSLVSELDEINNNSLVIEIGPGLGSLTQFLLEKAKKVICYEIDTQLADILKDTLKDYDNLEIVNQDFLSVDINTLDIKGYDNVVFVSNLPYYITSEILIKLLQAPLKFNIIAMMQKEVARRILDKKDLNELVIYSHLFSNISKVTEVSKNDFFPKPNVDSTILRFEKKDILNKDQYIGIINSLFKQRRKTIFNNLKEINGNEISDYFIDYVLSINKLTRLTRIDDLSINQIFDLINFIKGSIFIDCPAKLNLGLNILGKENGMHLFKSIFLPISLKDYLEVYITKEGFELDTNIEICKTEENTLYKVYEYLVKSYNFGLKIKLIKNIPLGSGMGGGSSDGGRLASLLSKVFNLDLESSIDLASKAGSDAIYFLDPKVKLLNKDLRHYEDYKIDLSSYNIHLLLNNLKVSTKDIFDRYDSLKQEYVVQDFIDLKSIKNDLEEVTISMYPELKKVSEKSREFDFISMTGSGSTFYYLIKKDKDTNNNDKFIVKIID